MRKIYQFVRVNMAVLMAAMVFCSCLAGSVSAEDSSAGETAEGVDVEAGGIKAADLGLTDEQAEEMYAYTAYTISKNYLEPNGISSTNVWDEANDEESWYFAHTVLDLLSKDALRGNMDQYSDYEAFVEAERNNYWATFDLLLITTVESMFDYYHFIGTYYRNSLDDSEFKALIIANVTFSDEQLALGAEVAERIATGSAGDSSAAETAENGDTSDGLTLTLADGTTYYRNKNIFDLDAAQAEELYAYMAYCISENYLKPNGIDAQAAWDGFVLSIDTWDPDADYDADSWQEASDYVGFMLSDAENGELANYSSLDEYMESFASAWGIEDGISWQLEQAIFRYCVSTDNYQSDSFNADVFEAIITQNITFSDEQLALGAEVAERIDAASAE